ncbi:MAG: enoyl-CoA hydratase-related protein [Ilumatobacter sp.]|uniref:enoyl-CoA hydratase-related protein n=1 Tax=Ilumatobacter sp. TaxID=1967498 RepID=UPI003C77CFF3
MDLTATRFEVEDRIATVWLDRPHRANAWTGQMHAEYRWIMAELEQRDDVRAVVVTGTGDRFCVGGDSAALTAHVERGGYDTGLPPEPARPGGGDGLDADFAWQMGYRLPIIAAVNGACAGVGLALALFCDLRFVTPEARMTTAAPKLGLPAEYGMSWTLPRLVGLARATDLLLSGRVFTGAETADWGLWNGVVEDPYSAARAWAANVAATTGPVAVATAKRQIAADTIHNSPAASVDESISLLDQAMGTDEYAEGIAAFNERRPPTF